MRLHFKKTISWMICVSILTTNSFFAHSYETSIWKERQKSTQLVSLLPQLPTSADVRLSDRVQSSIFLNPFESKSSKNKNSTLDIINNLPARLGSIRAVAPLKINPKKMVILVHDIHMNQEAQSNISALLTHLYRKQKLDYVAMEGLSGTIQLESYRNNILPDTLESVAHFLLETNKISGAVHSSLINVSTPPLIFGVEEPDLYLENINAYRASESFVHSNQAHLLKQEIETMQIAQNTLSPELVAFDSLVREYDQKKVQLETYLNKLSQYKGLSSPLKLFLRAVQLEKSINFKRVEQERASLINILSSKLTPVETQSLVEKAWAYRMSMIRIQDFYSTLSHVVSRQGVRMDQYPALTEYIEYINLSDAIDGEVIFKEIKSIEERIYLHLSRSPKDEKIINQLKLIRYGKKLLTFSLSSDEWDDYLHLKKLSILSVCEHLNSFESFYSTARKRDNVMVENYLKKINQTQSSGIGVFVVGGFHATAIKARLAQAGISTVSFVPKITKVNDMTGHDYLSVFTQEKTPLEKLVMGEKLFLAPNPSQGLGLVAFLSKIVEKARAQFKKEPESQLLLLKSILQANSGEGIIAEVQLERAVKRKNNIKPLNLGEPAPKIKSMESSVAEKKTLYDWFILFLKKFRSESVKEIIVDGSGTGLSPVEFANRKFPEFDLGHSLYLEDIIVTPTPQPVTSSYFGFNTIGKWFKLLKKKISAITFPKNLLPPLNVVELEVRTALSGSPAVTGLPQMVHLGIENVALVSQLNLFPSVPTVESSTHLLLNSPENTLAGHIFNQEIGKDFPFTQTSNFGKYSGLTNNRINNTFFITESRADKILQIDTNGNLLREINVSGLKRNDPLITRADPEDIIWMYGDTYAVVLNQGKELAVFKIPPGSESVSISRSDAIVYSLEGDPVGLTYISSKNTFYYVSDGTKQKIFEIKLNSNSLISEKLAEIDISALMQLGERVKAVAYFPLLSPHLFVLTNLSVKEINPGLAPIVFSEFSLADRGIPDPSALTFGIDGRMYILGKTVGGGVQENDFNVFAPDPIIPLTPPVANLGGPYVALDRDDNRVEPVSLNTNNTYDPYGALLEWSIYVGGQLVDQGIGEPGVSLKAPFNFPIGETSVRLSVRGNGGSNEAVTIVRVKDLASNPPPIARVSIPSFVEANVNGRAVVTINNYDGTFIPAGENALYVWTDNNIEIYRGTIPPPTLTLNGVGVHQLKLKIISTDSDGIEQTDETQELPVQVRFFSGVLSGIHYTQKLGGDLLFKSIIGNLSSVATTGRGTLYATDGQTNVLYEMNPDGTLIRTIHIPGLIDPQGIVVMGSENGIDRVAIVTKEKGVSALLTIIDIPLGNENIIVSVNPGQTYGVSGNPVGITYSIDEDVFYVVTEPSRNNPDARVIKLKVVPGAPRLLQLNQVNLAQLGIVNPADILYAPGLSSNNQDQQTLFILTSDGFIHELNLQDLNNLKEIGQPMKLPSRITRASGLAVDTRGNIYLVNKGTLGLTDDDFSVLSPDRNLAIPQPAVGAPIPGEQFRGELSGVGYSQVIGTDFPVEIRTVPGKVTTSRGTVYAMDGERILELDASGGVIRTIQVNGLVDAQGVVGISEINGVEFISVVIKGQAANGAVPAVPAKLARIEIPRGTGSTTISLDTTQVKGITGNPIGVKIGGLFTEVNDYPYTASVSGLAATTRGTLYATDGQTGRVLELNRDGTLRRVITIPGLVNPQGIVVMGSQNGADRIAIVTKEKGVEATLVMVNIPMGVEDITVSLTSLYTVPGNPVGVAYSKTEDVFYIVTEPSVNNPDAQVLKIKIIDGVRPALVLTRVNLSSLGISDPADILYAPGLSADNRDHQRLYVVRAADQSIWELNLLDPANPKLVGEMTLPTRVTKPAGVAIDEAGNLYLSNKGTFGLGDDGFTVYRPDRPLQIPQTPVGAPIPGEQFRGELSGVTYTQQLGLNLPFKNSIGSLSSITSTGRGTLYATDGQTNVIYEINPDGILIRIINIFGLTNPEGIIFMGENNGSDRIAIVTKEKGASATLTLLDIPKGKNNITVPLNPAQTYPISGNPVGVTYSGDENVFYVVTEPSLNNPEAQVFKFKIIYGLSDLIELNRVSLSSLGITNPTDILYAPGLSDRHQDQGTLFVLTADGFIHELNLQDPTHPKEVGEPMKLPGRITRASALAVDAKGNMYLVNKGTFGLSDDDFAVLSPDQDLRIPEVISISPIPTSPRETRGSIDRNRGFLYGYSFNDPNTKLTTRVQFVYDSFQQLFSKVTTLFAKSGEKIFHEIIYYKYINGQLIGFDGHRFENGKDIEIKGLFSGRDQLGRPTFLEIRNAQGDEVIELIQISYRDNDRSGNEVLIRELIFRPRLINGNLIRPYELIEKNFSPTEIRTYLNSGVLNPEARVPIEIQTFIFNKRGEPIDVFRLAIEIKPFSGSFDRTFSDVDLGGASTYKSGNIGDSSKLGAGGIVPLPLVDGKIVRVNPGGGFFLYSLPSSNDRVTVELFLKLIDFMSRLQKILSSLKIPEIQLPRLHLELVPRIEVLAPFEVFMVEPPIPSQQEVSTSQLSIRVDEEVAVFLDGFLEFIKKSAPYLTGIFFYLFWLNVIFPLVKEKIENQKKVLEQPQLQNKLPDNEKSKGHWELLQKNGTEIFARGLMLSIFSAIVFWIVYALKIPVGSVDFLFKAIIAFIISFLGYYIYLQLLDLLPKRKYKYNFSPDLFPVSALSPVSEALKEPGAGTAHENNDSQTANHQYPFGVKVVAKTVPGEASRIEKIIYLNFPEGYEKHVQFQYHGPNNPYAGLVRRVTVTRMDFRTGEISKVSFRVEKDKSGRIVARVERKKSSIVGRFESSNVHGEMYRLFIWPRRTPNSEQDLLAIVRIFEPVQGIVQFHVYSPQDIDGEKFSPYELINRDTSPSFVGNIEARTNDHSFFRRVLNRSVRKIDALDKGLEEIYYGGSDLLGRDGWIVETNQMMFNPTMELNQVVGFVTFITYPSDNLGIESVETVYKLPIMGAPSFWRDEFKGYSIDELKSALIESHMHPFSERGYGKSIDSKNPLARPLLYERSWRLHPDGSLAGEEKVENYNLEVETVDYQDSVDDQDEDPVDNIQASPQLEQNVNTIPPVPHQDKKMWKKTFFFMSVGFGSFMILRSSFLTSNKSILVLSIVLFVTSLIFLKRFWKIFIVFILLSFPFSAARASEVFYSPLTFKDNFEYIKKGIDQMNLSGKSSGIIDLDIQIKINEVSSLLVKFIDKSNNNELDLKAINLILKKEQSLGVGSMDRGYLNVENKSDRFILEQAIARLSQSRGIGHLDSYDLQKSLLAFLVHPVDISIPKLTPSGRILPVSFEDKNFIEHFLVEFPNEKLVLIIGDKDKDAQKIFDGINKKYKNRIHLVQSNNSLYSHHVKGRVLNVVPLAEGLSQLSNEEMGYHLEIPCQLFNGPKGYISANPVFNNFRGRMSLIDELRQSLPLRITDLDFIVDIAVVGSTNA
ncbi:MAG: SdiA-regulated domain-containing protein [Elusimicrobiota bacterium]